MGMNNCSQFGRCGRDRIDHLIKVEEKGKEFIIDNASQSSVCQVDVDGCLRISGPRCDYLFEVRNNEEVYYVELKGKNISHALEQILNTMRSDLLDRLHKGFKKVGVVVSSRVPSTGPDIQSEKKKWRQRGLRLEVATVRFVIKV